MINEKLGVPDNIVEEADRLHDFIHNLIEESDFYLPENEGEFILEIGETYIKMGEVNIENFPILLKLIYDKGVDGLHAPVLGIASNLNFSDEDGLIKIIQNNEGARLMITLIGNDLSKLDRVIRQRLTPDIIAHELKHIYDSHYSRSISLKSHVEYDAFQMSPDFFPRYVKRMFHLLYYVSTAENLVRPTEMYKTLMDKNITKSQFKKFMNTSEIIGMLNECINFSVGNLREEFERDPHVKEIIDHVRSHENYKNQGDYASDMFRLVFVNFGNLIMEIIDQKSKVYMFQNREKKGNLLDSIFDNPFSEPDVSEEVEDNVRKTMNKILKDYRKYSNNDNYMKFFEDIEKKLTFVGSKMKKKLYKLYDMMPEDKDSKISNWDLHTKIKRREAGVSEKIVLDFHDFKKKK